MRRGRLFWRLLEPIAVAALNTPSQEGLARLLAAVMRETLMRGGRACKPMLPREGLSEALIDPAIATLQARGAEIRFNSRIAELTLEAGRVMALRGPDGSVESGGGRLGRAGGAAVDCRRTAAGSDRAGSVRGDPEYPFPGEADPDGPLGEAGFIGLTSGTAEWVFMKPGHVSVTISAANNMVDDPARSIAAMVWPNVVDALDLPARAKESIPPYRVVKEKRATFAASAQQEMRRPQARTGHAANVALAGDWTDTGLPATIEGAIRSGRSAADVILSA